MLVCVCVCLLARAHSFNPTILKYQSKSKAWRPLVCVWWGFGMSLPYLSRQQQMQHKQTGEMKGALFNLLSDNIDICGDMQITSMSEDSLWKVSWNVSEYGCGSVHMPCESFKVDLRMRAQNKAWLDVCWQARLLWVRSTVYGDIYRHLRDFHVRKKA